MRTVGTMHSKYISVLQERIRATMFPGEPGISQIKILVQGCA